MANNPNDTQVGGDHYHNSTNNDLQHWDFMALQGVGYLEGTATKYLCRWRKKNGLQDLQKARHYVEKIQQMNRNNAYRRVGFAGAGSMNLFCDTHELNPVERRAFQTIIRWKTADDLDEALCCIDELMAEAERV